MGENAWHHTLHFLHNHLCFFRGYACVVLCMWGCSRSRHLDSRCFAPRSRRVSTGMIKWLAKRVEKVSNLNECSQFGHLLFFRQTTFILKPVTEFPCWINAFFNFIQPLIKLLKKERLCKDLATELVCQR